MSFQSKWQKHWFQSQFMYAEAPPDTSTSLFGDYVDVVLHVRETKNRTTPMDEVLTYDNCKPKGLCRRTTMLEELESKRAHLDQNLKQVEVAISALKANPDLANTLESVRSALRV